MKKVAYLFLLVLALGAGIELSRVVTGTAQTGGSYSDVCTMTAADGSCLSMTQTADPWAPMGVPFWTFLGGVVGGVGAFTMQWYAAVVDYPVNIAGRPLNSWPMFVPITFELAVLGAALSAIVAFLWGSGLPLHLARA